MTEQEWPATSGCDAEVPIVGSRLWPFAHGDLEVDDRGAIDRFQCADAQSRGAFECGDGDPVDADRVWAVGGAWLEDAGERDVGVSGRVGLEDISVGEVEPGEQDQLVADADAMKRVAEDGLDLEQRFGCALEGLIRGLSRRAQRRADDADRTDRVLLDFVHSYVSLARALSGSVDLVPALLAVGPRHGAVAAEDEVVPVVAGPDADLVAVGIDGDRWEASAGEQERPRRCVAAVHDLV